MNAEYWHMDSEGEGVAGPFASVAEAQADALQYAEDRFAMRKIKVVKTVSESDTKVSFETKWLTYA